MHSNTLSYDHHKSLKHFIKIFTMFKTIMFICYVSQHDSIMTHKQHKTHIKLSASQVALKKRLLKVYHKPYGFTYHHPAWAVGLWNRKTEEIHDYLKDRFSTTKDVVEYYSCMIYLLNVIPDDELLVEWQDSLQRVGRTRTFIKTDYAAKSLDIINMKETINHIGEIK